tara:strand:- start:8070 stop:8540 length:471 start_codon:yes stop_codon:yes gene_type:complete
MSDPQVDATGDGNVFPIKTGSYTEGTGAAPHDTFDAYTPDRRRNGGGGGSGSGMENQLNEIRNNIKHLWISFLGACVLVVSMFFAAFFWADGKVESSRDDLNAFQTKVEASFDKATESSSQLQRGITDIQVQLSKMEESQKWIVEGIRARGTSETN